MLDVGRKVVIPKYGCELQKDFYNILVSHARSNVCIYRIGCLYDRMFDGKVITTSLEHQLLLTIVV